MIIFPMERYFISSKFQLRKRQDIFLSELIKPIFKIVNAGYFLKIAISICTYAYMVGKVEQTTKFKGILSSFTSGLNSGFLLYFPMFLQLALYVSLVLSVYMGLFERCPNLIRMSKNDQQSRIDFQIKSKMTRKAGGSHRDTKVGHLKPKRRLSRSFSDVKKDVKS